MVDGVEEALDIHFEHPSAAHLRHPLPQGLQRVMRRASAPEAVRAVEKVLLVDGLQDRGDPALQHLILEGGDPDRARSTVALRDVHSPDRRRVVLARVHPVDQAPEVSLQVLFEPDCRLAVHAHRTVLARALIRDAEQVHVEKMSQRGEHHLRCLPRPCRYPL
jgi:hypothetical protein